MLFKKLLLISAIAVFPAYIAAQTQDEPKPNWQNLDLQKDGVFGISTELAYTELLKNKTAKPVTVAIIDGGIDELHEDLKKVMWVNIKEIAGNGKDDDKNGYVDDVNGWNFLGSERGDVEYDNLEMVRLIKKYQPKYQAALNSTPFDDQERKEFQLYKRLITDYMAKLQQAQLGLTNTTILIKNLDSITNKIGKEKLTLADFENYKAANDIESRVLKVVKSQLKKEPDYKKFREEIQEGFEYYDAQVKYNLNMDFDPRDIIGDNYNNSSERSYGNKDVTGPDAEHGTHVAGIVAAVRSNNLGVKGVADQVRVMAIRAVPNGDERDKDVANAIRYAVDNGAKVINMSFGKSYSWDKKVVDSAVKYAESKDVLLVHAAGNDSENTDMENNFPNRYYADTVENVNFIAVRPPALLSAPNGQGNPAPGPMSNRTAKPEEDELKNPKFERSQAKNWIEVGASSWKDDEDLVAVFSNYGKKSVDVFAPGVKINSTMPNSTYKENDGTSMASPVVAGLAALIRSYYPNLTAVQIKDIIMKSVTKVDQKVKIRENGSSKRVVFTDVCISGGVVNTYNALLLASKTQAQSK